MITRLVLITVLRHAGHMTALLILLVLIVLFAGAAFYGTDSRRDDDRGWWPGRNASR